VSGGNGKPPWRHRLLVWRAKRILKSFDGFLRRGDSVLSVGDGDGYVARQMIRDHGVEVRGLEVEIEWPGRRTEVECDTYDGRTMPYGDGSFDCVTAVFVLHHCDDVEQVFREIVRVSRSRVVICEDVYRTRPGRLVVCGCDWLLNRCFGEGVNLPFNFRTVDDWHETFGRLGLEVESSKPFKLWKYWPVTHQVFCLRKVG